MSPVTSLLHALIPSSSPAVNNCRQARIVANPGCYPTSVQLPLVPLLAAGLISHEDIIIDAKSGAVQGSPCTSSAVCLVSIDGQGLLAGGLVLRKDTSANAKARESCGAAVVAALVQRDLQ